MIRIRNFVTYLLGGTRLSSDFNSFGQAARMATRFFRPDGGTVFNEAAVDPTETPEQRSRRLKRERDRRYKANKKAKAAAAATGQPAFA